MTRTADLTADVGDILLTEQQIADKVAELGRRIGEDYAGRNLTLVSVLKGSLPFMADLMRQIPLPLRIDLMEVSSYGGAQTESSGLVRIIKDLSASIADEDVLLVEDIIDTGLTLNYLVRYLRGKNPAALRICTLLDKPARRLVDIPVDYVGFEIPDQFVVGYGLDYGERYRNLRFVGVLRPEVYTDDSTDASATARQRAPAGDRRRRDPARGLRAAVVLGRRRRWPAPDRAPGVRRDGHRLVLRRPRDARARRAALCRRRATGLDRPRDLLRDPGRAAVAGVVLFVFTSPACSTRWRACSRIAPTGSGSRRWARSSWPARRTTSGSSRPAAEAGAAARLPGPADDEPDEPPRGRRACRVRGPFPSRAGRRAVGKPDGATSTTNSPAGQPVPAPARAAPSSRCTALRRLASARRVAQTANRRRPARRDAPRTDEAGR